REIHGQHRAAYLRAPQVRPIGAGLDLSGRRKDRSLFPVDISLSHAETEHGPLVIALVRDVSRRKRLTEHTELLAALSLALVDAPDTKTALRAVIERVLGYTGWVYGEALLPSGGDGCFRLT